MKRTSKALLTVTLVLSLLLGCLTVLPASALSYEVNEELTATNILKPVNPNASQEAQNLLAYLSQLTNTNQFVVGQFDISTDEQILKMLKEQYGDTMPALYSNRYVVDENLNITNMKEANDLLEKHYKAGDILLVHMDGFYGLQTIRNWGTDLVLDCDSTNPDRDMALYAKWETYYENMFEALKDLESRGVNAYLFRDHVEFNTANAVYFYTSSDQARATIKTVYQQTVDRFKQSGLKGWLMAYSPVSFGDTYDCYPGNDYIDTLGVTLYTDYSDGTFLPDSFGSYDWFLATGKPVGLPELSVRHGERNTNLIRSTWYNGLHDLMEKWPRLTWVNVWGNSYYSLWDKAPAGDPLSGLDDGKAFLNSPFSINSTNIADYQKGVWTHAGIAQVYKKADYEGDFVGLEERVYTAAELKTLGISAATLGSVKINDGYGLYLYSGDNATGDHWGLPASVRKLAGLMGSTELQSLEVRRQTNIAKDVSEIYASHNDEEAWKANDGQTSRWMATASEGWLEIRFDNMVTVNRYVVKHAGASSMAKLYNTADFKLQYTLDGVNWITVDEVIGNTADSTSKSIAPFTANRIRLLITKPNTAEGGEAQQITITDWELYGMDLGKTQVSATPPLSNDTDTPEEEEPEYDTVMDDDDDLEEPAEEPTEEEEKEESSKPSKKPVKNTYTETYFPWWLWVVIGVGVLVVAGGIVVIILVVKKKKANNA